MKKTTLLKSMLLLCALIVGSLTSWAETETVTPTTSPSNGFSGAMKFTYVAAKLSSGSSNPLFSSDGNVKLYVDNTLTITPQNGETITALSISATWNQGGKSGSKAYPTGMSANIGTLTVGEIGSGSKTITWSGSTKAALVLTIEGSKGNLQVTEITVTYTEASSKHTATFSVNGVTSSSEVAEDASIPFPSDPSDIGDKIFMGWTTSAIVGTTNDEPTLVTSATMGTSDVTYYAVFASQADIAGNITLTIVPGTTNLPTGYADAEDYTLEGKEFTIHQMYKNGTKLQFKASVGYITNKDVMKNIKRVVITYNSSDTNKNFTLNVGDATNPTSGTEITPSNSGSVYTFDCSTYNKSFFVLKNGSNAGYLDEIAITYEGFVKSYSAYCTTVAVATNVAITIAASGYSSIASGYGLDFANATPAGLEAYVASEISTGGVTLTSVDEAPASTGIVLKGTAGTEYTIPVKANATFGGTNKLKAAVSSTGVDANSAYILKGGKFCLVTNASIVPAGKAYLLASDVPAAAPELAFDFGGTTAMDKVRSQKEEANGVFYNLAGQRVAQPTKGLYIVNGKKVVIK